VEIIKPYYVIETDIETDPDAILQNLERYGRTAYKSEDKITSDSAKKFIAGIIKSGHESVIEHESLTVRFICDRGVTHEIVRHRLFSYTQESTRFCNYAKKGVTFINPLFWDSHSVEFMLWMDVMICAEDNYNKLIAMGATPQQARSVLPNSLKTEIVCTSNLREWRHFFKLRTAKSAHPQFRELSVPLLKELKTKIPAIFDDIEPYEGE
jgi:thymidylate synthase (FAD)